MVTGGKKIGDEENGFAAAGEFDGLDIGVVAGNGDGGDSRSNFGVAGERLPLSGLLQREEIFFEVAGAVTFGGIGGVGDFGGLHDVFGVGKSGNNFAVNESCVAAGMVEVQMGVDDGVDLTGADTVCR